MKKLLLPLVSVMGIASAQAVTYFTSGAPTTSTSVNTYATDAAGIASYTLGTTTAAFTSATILLPNPEAADYIQALAEDWGPTTRDFSINTAFPSYSASQALWMEPDGSIGTDTYDGFDANIWGVGTWTVSVPFNIDDVSAYTDYFVEGRHYADDVVTISINGNVVPTPSLNPAWDADPAAASSSSIDSSFLVTGTNTIEFLVENTNPDGSPTGPSGLAAYGRIGGIEVPPVPEPSSAVLFALGASGLFVRRKR